MESRLTEEERRERKRAHQRTPEYRARKKERHHTASYRERQTQHKRKWRRENPMKDLVYKATKRIRERDKWNQEYDECITGELNTS